MTTLCIGIVDTGVNAWHSHVRGDVDGCRIHVCADGTIGEDEDFRDASGHGTAVAGVLREALPDALLYAVRVFDGNGAAFPTLVARGILRAAAQRCQFINLSLAVPPGPGAQAIAAACAAAQEAGCVIVAAERAGAPDWLPAALPGVHAVVADDSLRANEVRVRGTWRLAAAGYPRTLASRAPEANFAGASFACARGLAYLAQLSRSH